MAKRTEQILLAKNTRPGSVERRVQDALKLPAQNHAATDGDEFAGAVERVVFDGRSADAFLEGVEDFFGGATSDQCAPKLTNTTFKVPFQRFWLEIGGHAFLFDDIGCGAQLDAFRRFDDGSVSFASRYWLAPAGDGFRFHGHAQHEEWAMDAFVFEGTFFFISACVAVCQPNVRDVKRIVPGQASEAERIALRRAAQRGRPWFSHNVVTMRLGDTSRHGGEVGAGGLGSHCRAYHRIAHWRLIAPANGEPAYFTWVVDAECGDAELGRVCKTRIASEPSGREVRRGFLVPEFAGTSGMRVRATTV